MKNSAERAALFDLLKTHAFKKGDFVLASGQRSNFYLNCKQVMFSPEGLALVGTALFSALVELEARFYSERPHFEGIGGMALGAVPLCLALTMTAFHRDRRLPSLIVRNTAKDHGDVAAIEGLNWVKQNSHVLLLEDVTTTGASTLKAADALRAHGYQVSDVITVVDRQCGARTALAGAQLQLWPLFDVSEFTA